MRPLILDPSLLSADFGNLAADLAALKASGTPAVHFDMMDGLFVPSISMGFPVLKAVRANTDLIVDAHMMVTDPIRYVDECAACGADWITIHLEACADEADTEEALRRIRSLGCRAGLSIRPDTPVESIKPFLPLTDLILIMSVQPGFGGQPYLPGSTERIREAKALIDASGLPIDLQVDGGINKDNLAEVLRAGINVVVSGSSVFKRSIPDNVRDFLAVMDEVDRERQSESVN